VAWRFKAIMVAGLIAGILLAVFTAYKVSISGPKHFTPRGREQWTSHSTLFVTQAGFPWGRVTLPEAAPGVTGDTRPNATRPGKGDFAQPDRFSNLAVVYSYIGQSEQVRQLINPRPAQDQIQVSSVISGDTVLPLLNVNTIGFDPRMAQVLNTATIASLRDYIAEQQQQSGIPDVQRVKIQVLNPPSVATLTKGRSVIGPALAFLLCVLTALGLSYLLENLFPRRGAGDGTPSEAALEPFVPAAEALEPDPLALRVAGGQG
jgi:hypothetical protein